MINITIAFSLILFFFFILELTYEYFIKPIRAKIVFPKKIVEGFLNKNNNNLIDYQYTRKKKLIELIGLDFLDKIFYHIFVYEINIVNQEKVNTKIYFVFLKPKSILTKNKYFAFSENDKFEEIV